MKRNKQLEIELRKEYNNYQSKAHPEDRMSFINYIEELNVFKGYKINLNRDGWGDIEINFIKK